ncbi:aromatic-ring-hydroxylating dioxygenase subunit beta [Sphingomonas flavalba]|uniref:aromatic-ring-hydroxylating dioxygenase subunit beta n=1 Tax=Sphingomonas flavalba TaxID=2559804 RepID=UPI0039E1E6EA
MGETTVDPDIAAEAATLLHREAALLDAADLEAWLTLYTQDCFYWMPLVEDQADPFDHPSIIFENRHLMEIRRRNLTVGTAPSKDYTIRGVRMIGDIAVAPCAEAPGEFIATSKFVAVIRWRRKEYHAGHCEHRLRATPDGLRIVSKRVNLIDSDLPMETMITYL